MAALFVLIVLAGLGGLVAGATVKLAARQRKPMPGDDDEDWME